MLLIPLLLPLLRIILANFLVIEEHNKVFRSEVVKRETLQNTKKLFKKQLAALRTASTANALIYKMIYKIYTCSIT